MLPQEQPAPPRHATTFRETPHMNNKQIIGLAALLAVQAAILSLLHASVAQAEKVYRCGAAYQQQPCDPQSTQDVLDMRDARSSAQVAQAREQSKSEGKAFRQLMRQRQREIHERPKAKAVALSAAKPGDGPFDHGPALSDAQSKGKSQIDLKHQRKPLRLAKVPKPVKEPQAGILVGQR
jgi:hypothetical protein